MHSNENFLKNVSLWERMFPADAEIVRKYEPKHTAFCETANGQINLLCETDLGQFPLHGEDPLDEAKNWFGQLHLNGITALCIYGIGLGYGFLAAKDWLKENPEASIIFIEDNIEVIYRFFETELGTEFLQCPQALLCGLISGADAWAKLCSNLILFSRCTFEHQVSPWKWRMYPILADDFMQRMSYIISLVSKTHREFATLDSIVLDNAIVNSLKVDTMQSAESFFGKFANIPAIICGPGPSLDKNINVLKTLTDRAIIFAGGTGVNAIDNSDVIPHFGVSLDPNLSQFTRIITSKSYETPFFITSRINTHALNTIYGGRLLLRSSHVTVGGLYEKEMGFSIEKKEDVDEGFNVLNFSFSLAQFLGCNPIICVGIDLAYSGGKSYSAKVVNHPLFPPKKHLKSKSFDDILISKVDIYGRPVDTLWKWVGESSWYSHFSEKFPKLKVINATEGGLGFPGIQNLSLQEVKETFLTKSYDFHTWTLGEVLNAPFVEKKSHRIQEETEKLLSSLKSCIENYKKIREKLASGVYYDDDSIKYILDETKQEFAYKCIIYPFDVQFENIDQLRVHRLKWHEEIYTPEELLTKRNEILDSRLERLIEGSVTNSIKIESFLETDKQEKKFLSEWTKGEGAIVQQKLKEKYTSFPNDKSIYKYENNFLTLIDPEVHLHVEENFVPEPSKDTFRLFYENGAIKFEQFYLNNELHGPSTYYAENGNILVRTWFYQGKREGKMYSYYPDGSVHSIQKFKEGLQDGQQIYYYPTGLPKTVLPYKKGRLDGEVLIFYPSGLVNRSIQYSGGTRNGAERSWDPFGRIWMEGYYDNDKPVGKAKEFYANGRLKQEIVYDDSSKVISNRAWEIDGKEYFERKPFGEEYFTKMGTEMQNLTNLLENSVSKLDMIPKSFPGNIDMSSSLVQMQEAMEKLQNINTDLHKVLRPEEEDIMLNAEFQKQVEKMIQDEGKLLGGYIQDLEANLSDLLKKLNPPSQDGENHDTNK